MSDLRSIFSRASVDFMAANPCLSAQPEKKNYVQPIQNSKKRHSMTKPEREMAMQLEAMRRNNEIESWKFEGVTLKLADGCRFTPDFTVIIERSYSHDDNDIQISWYVTRFIETKGPFIREDSMIKFKIAREQNPWAEWQLHQRNKNGWTQII